MMAEEAGRFDIVKDAAGGRIERWRLFLSEVRNELRRVTWPSQKEVYATTVVVILTSMFFGVYLFVLDYASELLFVGDAGTTEASRPSRRVGVEFTNQFKPLPWMAIGSTSAR